jgi:hypothetical protein
MSALSFRHRPMWVPARTHPLVVLAYSTGAAAIAGVGAVHIQQYVASMHLVRWIGPLFLLNAAACAATLIGLGFRSTRQLAALTGVAISGLTLAALVVSYGHGLFGWHEAGFRTSIAVDVVTTVVAMLALTLSLTIAAVRPESETGRRGRSD